jgi:hypothetical protein
MMMYFSGRYDYANLVAEPNEEGVLREGPLSDKDVKSVLVFLQKKTLLLEAVFHSLKACLKEDTCTLLFRG